MFPSDLGRPVPRAIVDDDQLQFWPVEPLIAHQLQAAPDAFRLVPRADDHADLGCHRYKVGTGMTS